MKSHELKKKMETDGLSLGYSLRFFVVLRQHYLERRRWG